VQTSIHTTVGALLTDEPIAAVPCQREPIALPAGSQELLISPGDAFVVDGAQLNTEHAGGPSPPAAVTPARVGTWGPDRREVYTGPASPRRVLVVPESVNPGWVAQSADGTPLTPIVVNGWQQGWVVPAGLAGTIVLTFPSNALYRAGLGWGLALLPVLMLLALVRPRRRVDDDAPATTWRIPPAAAATALLASGWLISGWVGVVVFGAALGVRRLVSPRRAGRVTVGTTAAAFILAGALLSRYPWRSVSGYVGHSWVVQLPALIAIGALAASVTLLSSGGAVRRYSQRRNATRHGDSTSE
jgi:arabinofuranan 3-O-arabinosyltransferase